MKNRIPVRVLVEIENQIARAKETGALSYSNLAKLMRDNTVSCDVLAKYIDMALDMPRKEIEMAIKEYDNAKPKMDAVKFVDSLAEKYGVEKDCVVKRIHIVHLINNFEEDE